PLPPALPISLRPATASTATPRPGANALRRSATAPRRCACLGSFSDTTPPPQRPWSPPLMPEERSMDPLAQLEKRSVPILREAYAAFRHLGMLGSIGKDRTVL